MAINKKLIHFNTKANFITKKLSANVNDTQYYTYNADGTTTTVTTGAPDIKYSSIVFIKDTKEIWTHGQLYSGSISDNQVTEYVTTLNNRIKNVANQLDTTETTLTNKINTVENDLNIATDNLVNHLDDFEHHVPTRPVNVTSDMYLKPGNADGEFAEWASLADNGIIVTMGDDIDHIRDSFVNHKDDPKIHVPAADAKDKILFSKADGTNEWKLPEDNMYIGTTRLDLDDHINNNSIHVPTSSKDPAGNYQYLVVNPEGEREWINIAQDLTVSDTIQATSDINNDLTNHKNNTKIHVPAATIADKILVSKADGSTEWKSYNSSIGNTMDDLNTLNQSFTNHINDAATEDAGLTHIPSGGSSGNILSWSSSGVAQWQDPANAIPNATSIKDGLMSSYDKGTLDSLSKHILLDELNSISMDQLEKNSIYMLWDDLNRYDLNRCIGWVKTGDNNNFLKVSGNLYYNRTTNLFVKSVVYREFYVRVIETSFDVYSPQEYDAAYIDIPNKTITDIEGHTLTYKDLYPGRKIMVTGINKTGFTATKEYPGICIVTGSTYIRIAVDSCLFEIDLNMGMIFAAFNWATGKVF